MNLSIITQQFNCFTRANSTIDILSSILKYYFYIVSIERWDAIVSIYKANFFTNNWTYYCGFYLLKSLAFHQRLSRMGPISIKIIRIWRKQRFVKLTNNCVILLLDLRNFILQILNRLNLALNASKLLTT